MLNICVHSFDTGIIGPTTVMGNYVSMFGHPTSAVHGIIVSCILLSASLSSFFAGRLADVLGRPRALALGAAIFAVGAAIQASAVHIAMFAVGRIIEGLGEGLYFGTQTMFVLVLYYERPTVANSANSCTSYISEISPPRMRGSLTSGPQLMICTALAVGYFTCYGTATLSDSMSWRLPFIILAILSLLYALAALFLLPASPRWLISHGRDAEAAKVWDVLGVQHADRLDSGSDTGDDTLSEVSPEHQDDRKSDSNANFRELFAHDVRKRTILAIFLMGFLQLSGIDAVLYVGNPLPLTVADIADNTQYAPLLFQQAGLQSSEASFLASGVSGIVIVAASIPAMLFADRWGRRTITMVGGAGMSITMLVMAGIYAGKAVHPHSGGGRWVAIVCIYFYSVLVSRTPSSPTPRSR